MPTNNTLSKFVTSCNLIPICILMILQEHSDESHKLTQGQIGKYLMKEYNITAIDKKTGLPKPIDRRTIGRTIDRLIEELDIPIAKTNNSGVWLKAPVFVLT